MLDWFYLLLPHDNTDQRINAAKCSQHSMMEICFVVAECRMLNGCTKKIKVFVFKTGTVESVDF